MLHVFAGLKDFLPGTSSHRNKPNTEGIVASLHYKVGINFLPQLQGTIPASITR